MELLCGCRYRAAWKALCDVLFRRRELLPDENFGGLPPTNEYLEVVPGQDDGGYY